jgi:NADPH:quinone reductase-like Zn-dependent oxidoreductase
MRAMAIEQFGGPDKIRELDVDEPLVGPDGILIRVASAGVNPVDYKTREGKQAQRFPHFFPLVLGWDAAGVVEEVGPAITEFKPGDRVYAYARKDFVRDGTYAELVSVRPHHLAVAPASLGLVEAGAVPLAGLTAWQLVFDALAITEGDTVLVHAAVGGVGSFAVQLARMAGATVLGTASARNHDFARELGVSEPIDYRERDFAEAVRELHPDGVDAVVDLVGGDTLARSASVLREGGRVASVIATPSAEDFPHAARRRYVFVRTDAAELAALADAIDAGHVRVHVSETLPLAEAARAHRLLEDGGVRGKVVLAVEGS